MLSEKKILNETKNHPLLPCKLNGRSLIHIFPGWVQSLQYKVAGLNYLYGPLIVLIDFDGVLLKFALILLLFFLPSHNMNQVPENYDLVRNRIKQKLSGQCKLTSEIESSRDSFDITAIYIIVCQSVDYNGSWN